VANRPPAAEGHRTIWRAICDGLAGGLDAGLADGLADGLRQHLPGGIAILVKGTPLCMLSAFIHFVLDVALPPTAVAVLLGAAGIGGMPPLVRALRPTDRQSHAIDGSAPDNPPPGHIAA
jgi:hypothetical protein